MGAQRFLLPLTAAVVLAPAGGCTAISIADMEPAIADGSGAPCRDDNKIAELQMLITHNAKAMKTLAEIKQQLPPAMKDDPVVDAFLRLARNSVKKGVDAASRIAPRFSAADLPQEQTPGDIGQGELKDFTRKVLREEMKPVMSASSKIASSSTPAPKLPDTFVTYFKEYYDGKYVDRFGENIAKPTVSLTVSDQDIAGALSVLVDYIIDTVDQTPVWGTDPGDKVTSSTTFYPGEGKEPTVLVAYGINDDTYKQLSTTSCGIDKAKAKILAELSSAAADEGGTLSGLVHGSFGGFEVGLGFLGKFSFGDDQTLAAIVKTAGSRLSARLTLAATWPILASIDYRDAELRVRRQ
jgi:hypothetical protein